MNFVIAQNPALAYQRAAEEGFGRPAYRYLTLSRFQGGNGEFQPQVDDRVILGDGWEAEPTNVTLVAKLRELGVKVEMN